MPASRILSVLTVAAALACANGGGVNTTGDRPNGDPGEGAGAPGRPDAGAPAGAGDADAPGDPDPTVPAGATPMELQPIMPATHIALGIRTPRRVVLRSEEEWREWYHELYSHMTPRPTPYFVDFESRMVIAATMGQRYSGGHVIAIESVHEAPDGTLYVTVLSSSPAADCVTSQMLTAPAVAVSVERRSGGVVFVEESVELGC